MQARVPSFLEDLAFLDDSEDTRTMVRDLGLALLDDINDFEAYLDADFSAPMVGALESCAYRLLDVYENDTFQTPPDAASMATVGQDVCNLGLPAQPPESTHLAGLDDPITHKKHSAVQDVTALP